MGLEWAYGTPEHVEELSRLPQSCESDILLNSLFTSIGARDDLVDCANTDHAPYHGITRDVEVDAIIKSGRDAGSLVLDDRDQYQ